MNITTTTVPPDQCWAVPCWVFKETGVIAGVAAAGFFLLVLLCVLAVKIHSCCRRKYDRDQMSQTVEDKDTGCSTSRYSRLSAMFISWRQRSSASAPSTSSRSLATHLEEPIETDYTPADSTTTVPTLSSFKLKHSVYSKDDRDDSCFRDELDGKACSSENNSASYNTTVNSSVNSFNVMLQPIFKTEVNTEGSEQPHLPEKSRPLPPLKTTMTKALVKPNQTFPKSVASSAIVDGEVSPSTVRARAGQPAAPDTSGVDEQAYNLKALPARKISVDSTNGSTVLGVDMKNNQSTKYFNRSKKATYTSQAGVARLAMHIASPAAAASANYKPVTPIKTAKSSTAKAALRVDNEKEQQTDLTEKGKPGQRKNDDYLEVNEKLNIHSDTSRMNWALGSQTAQSSDLTEKGKPGQRKNDDYLEVNEELNIHSDTSRMNWALGSQAAQSSGLDLTEKRKPEQRKNDDYIDVDEELNIQRHTLKMNLALGSQILLPSEKSKQNGMALNHKLTTTNELQAHRIRMKPPTAMKSKVVTFKIPPGSLNRDQNTVRENAVGFPEPPLFLHEQHEEKIRRIPPALSPSSTRRVPGVTGMPRSPLSPRSTEVNREVNINVTKTQQKSFESNHLESGQSKPFDNQSSRTKYTVRRGQVSTEDLDSPSTPEKQSPFSAEKCNSKVTEIRSDKISQVNAEYVNQRQCRPIITPESPNPRYKCDSNSRPTTKKVDFGILKDTKRLTRSNDSLITKSGPTCDASIRQLSPYVNRRNLPQPPPFYPD